MSCASEHARVILHAAPYEWQASQQPETRSLAVLITPQCMLSWGQPVVSGLLRILLGAQAGPRAAAGCRPCSSCCKAPGAPDGWLWLLVWLLACLHAGLATGVPAMPQLLMEGRGREPDKHSPGRFRLAWPPWMSVPCWRQQLPCGALSSKFHASPHLTCQTTGCRAGPSAAAAEADEPLGGKENQGTNAPAPKNGKAKKRARALNRPLIAICNDLYAPALRPLRPVAKILQFAQPQVSMPRPAHRDL